MTQANLPFHTDPRDRGRLNSLKSIIAAVSDELRQNADVANGIVDFTTGVLPTVIKQHAPFDLVSVDHSNPQLISPYKFEILDLLDNRPATPEVFPSVIELSACFGNLAEPLKEENLELIGIDESQVDIPLPHSTLAFLKTSAFRMAKTDTGIPDEAVGPMVSRLRMKLSDGENFEDQNRLLGYIRNNFIAYISALNSLISGRNPFVVLHGPLVRTIGGFADITFDYETASQLLNVNLPEAGEFNPPATANQPAFTGDAATQQNLSPTLQDSLQGENNLRQFNEFCFQKCGKTCTLKHPFTNKNASEPLNRYTTVTDKLIKERDYPGYCLYFWVLRSLLDLARLSKTNVSSVVEDVSMATETLRYALPSLLTIQKARQAIQNSSLKAALKKLSIDYPSQPNERGRLYNLARKTIQDLGLCDATIFSYLLSEGQYTAPVQIHRYRSRDFFVENLGDNISGTHNDFNIILNKLFPTKNSSNDSGYRVLMSYVRTSPLREPVRVEYFDLEHLRPPRKVIGPLYLLSLPYQEYGLPVILYYADKVARTPTQLVRTIIEREYTDIILKNKFDEPVQIMRALGKLSRGYFQREGLK